LSHGSLFQSPGRKRHDRALRRHVYVKLMDLQLHSPRQIERALERLLPRVQKPGRYTRGEHNQIVKNWDEVDFRVALAVDDIYDIDLCHLGLMTLYDIVYKHRNLLAEQTFCPWLEMDEQMRAVGMPL